jgi:hypothetical protein
MLYYLISYFLLLLPILFTVLFYYLVQKQSWSVRYSIIIAGGWCITVLSVQLFHWFIFTYAPTTVIQEQLAASDGASNVFSLLFGWVLPLILTLMIDTIRWIWHHISQISK